jgi:hypothetical protein
MKPQRREGRSPAEPEIRNPKSEIRNKFEQMEMAETEKREEGNFVAACERLWL